MRQVARSEFNTGLQDAQRFALSADVALETKKYWNCADPQSARDPRIKNYEIGYSWDGKFRLMFRQTNPLTSDSTFFVDEDEVMLFKARIAQ